MDEEHAPARKRTWRAAVLAVAMTALVATACVLLSSRGGARALVESSEDLGTVKEASSKLSKWWKEVGEMQSEVKKFQAEANDKAVDELVHLERVKDLLVELKKQVPVEEQPKQWGYSGDVGPQYWADLDPTYKTCGTGKEQSP